MYSCIKQDKKDNIIDQKCVMPPMLTMSILIMIISFVMFARGIYNTRYEEVSIPTKSSNIVIYEDKELNSSELEILNMLSKVIILLDPVDQENIIDTVYDKTLEYLSSPGVYLTTRQVLYVKDKINDMQGIISFEEQADFINMSLDGRKMVIYISEQIYEIGGLKLTLNIDGVIKRISDLSGNAIYINNTTTSQLRFQINALVIIVSLMVILFIICIIIAKNNQLLHKEVVYDGFDEERFA